MTTLWQWLVGLPAPILGGVVLIGAFLSALGSFLVLARQSRISEGIRTQVEENLKQTGENLKQTHEVITRIEKTIAYITGGDSFCYVLLGNLSGEGGNSVYLIVRHQGQYPLHDVTIRIQDLEKAARIRVSNFEQAWEKMVQTATHLPVGNMAAGEVRVVSQNWPLPAAEQQSYNIFISAQNDFFTQFIRLRRADGRWKFATKVLRDRDGDVLYEQIDRDFPRDANGQVQWEAQENPTAAEPAP